MDTLNISTGLIRLPVSVDGVNGRELTFNPNDVLFIERLHRLYRVVIDKANEWQSRENEIQAKIDNDLQFDENGVPVTLEPITDVHKEMNAFMREQIDIVFGAGTSQAIFGDAVYRNPEIYLALVEGVRPYVEQSRTEKIQKYLPPEPKRKPSKPRKRTKK